MTACGDASSCCPASHRCLACRSMAARCAVGASRAAPASSRRRRASPRRCSRSASAIASSACRRSAGFPPEVATLPKVGTFLKPDVELIARLEPDLVFVHTGPERDRVAAGVARHPDGGRRSRVAGQRVLDDPADRRRGRRAGPGATRCVADITAAARSRARRPVAGRPPRKVLIIVGRRTGTLTDIIAVGPGSYLHDIADDRRRRERAGARRKLEYPRISMETVISLAPDVIIDIGEMGESPAELRPARRSPSALAAPDARQGRARRAGCTRSTTRPSSCRDRAIVDVARTDGALAARSASRR